MGRDADGNLTMPASVWGDALDPLISMSLWTGDLGLQDGSASSVYVLDKADATQVMKRQRPAVPHGPAPRRDASPCPTASAAVTFEGLQRWNKIQISRSPGKLVALCRGRRSRCWACWARSSCARAGLWVRARRQDDGTTLVEVARLDRSSGGDPEDGAAELAEIVAACRRDRREDRQQQGGRVVTDAQWEVFSYQAVIGRRGALLPRDAGLLLRAGEPAHGEQGGRDRARRRGRRRCEPRRRGRPGARPEPPQRGGRPPRVSC